MHHLLLFVPCGLVRREEEEQLQVQQQNRVRWSRAERQSVLVEVGAVVVLFEECEQSQ